MRYFFCFCFTILSFLLHAQDSSVIFHIQKDSGVYTKVDTMPRFNGNLSQFLSEKVEYPIKEREDSIEGTVYIGFIIEKDGTMDSIKVLKGIDPTLDLEALKGVKKLPKKWKPGIQNGKPERVKYTIPIIFKLR